MAESTENGILQYLESVLAPENAKTFTEQQTGLGREGFRKYIPDPTQVADYLQDDGFLSEIADFINNNSQGVADDLTKEGGLFGDTTFEREVTNRRTDTPSFNPEKYITRPLPEMSAINPDDRSIFSNLKGGGIEAVLLDKYPELENNPAFNLTRMIVPRTLGESAFELATMYPPLFWMKGLKRGSKGYNQAAKYQDEIDDFKNIIDREKRNQTQDRGPAIDAVFNNQQKIRTKESQILDILRRENPEYAADIRNTAEKKLAQEKLEADPLYAVKQRMANKDNDNVIQFPKKDEGIESLDNGGFFPKGGFDFPNIRGGTDKIGVIDPMDAKRKEYRKYLETIKDDPRYASRSADVHLRSREEIFKDAPGHREDIANKNRIFEGETTEEVLRSPSRVGDPDVDAMEKFYRGPDKKSKDPTKNPNALVDQSSTLKGTESELMPPGFKTGDELMDDYNDQFSSVLDDLMSPKAPKKTNTDDLSIFELLERIKDIDPD